MQKHIEFHDDVHAREINQDEKRYRERPEFRIRVHFDTCSSRLNAVRGPIEPQFWMGREPPLGRASQRRDLGF